MRVGIVGGGVAGLKALAQLRRLAGPRVALELITPEPAVESSSTAMDRVLAHRPPTRLDVAEVTESTGARLVLGSAAAIDVSTAAVTLTSGEVRTYDRLLVSVGARAEESIAGALTVGVPGGARRFRRMLQYAQTGEVADLVFAVPALVGVPLAIYQLCLLAARRLGAASRTAPHLTLITPERAPLSEFGASDSAAVTRELEANGVHVITGVMPEEIVWGELRASPGRVRINGDVVVTMPRLRGPALAGLPADEHGFIEVDDHGLVSGATDVHAAGDATTFFAVKDGGLAAQEAVIASESIAAALGVPLAPRAFRPVLQGILAADRSPDPVTAGGTGAAAPLRVRAQW